MRALFPIQQKSLKNDDLQYGNLKKGSKRNSNKRKFQQIMPDRLANKMNNVIMLNIHNGPRYFTKAFADPVLAQKELKTPVFIVAMMTGDEHDKKPHNIAFSRIVKRPRVGDLAGGDGMGDGMGDGTGDGTGDGVGDGIDGIGDSLGDGMSGFGAIYGNSASAVDAADSILAGGGTIAEAMDAASIIDDSLDEDAFAMTKYDDYPTQSSIIDALLDCQDDDDDDDNENQKIAQKSAKRTSLKSKDDDTPDINNPDDNTTIQDTLKSQIAALETLRGSALQQGKRDAAMIYAGQLLSLQNQLRAL